VGFACSHSARARVSTKLLDRSSFMRGCLTDFFSLLYSADLPRKRTRDRHRRSTQDGGDVGDRREDRRIPREGEAVAIGSRKED
jgi:hypothetical protein